VKTHRFNGSPESHFTDVPLKPGSLISYSTGESYMNTDEFVAHMATSLFAGMFRKGTP
jgi:hypothetical protein